MRTAWLLGWSLVLGLAGCAAEPGEDIDDESWLDGKGDGASAVDVARTNLQVDLATRTAVATIELERYGNVALEVGGLTITDVTDDRGHRRYKILAGKLLVSRVLGPLVVTYGFAEHANADGLLPGGSTVIWPYFCGNVFPCHSQPADGTTFTLALDGIPAGKTAVYPEAIDADAPPYMLAWAVGAYTRATLGTTAAGTKLTVDWLPGGETAARAGTKNLVKVFDWFEKTLGPYSFGSHAGAVSVVWGEGLYGGMEHHPLWHVAKDAMADEVTQAHEAAHGWFGDGVRLRCWEDFVLSEGTVSYLSARALAKVAGPTMEAKIWADYQRDLDDAIATGGAPAWPKGCNQIDIIRDKLFTNLPYMQGAFFYKDVAAQVGADVLDGVIGRFYRAHANKAASMQDMVDAIKADTGFDPTPIVEARLRKQF
ncbi:MAG: peptidase M1 [Deltaproteobacteria bacterium]|nr:peptidase M1 [Deltaproteobacteria bacterium]MDQ3299786.1 peptidase M1 [Myxococcota bacterium]